MSEPSTPDHTPTAEPETPPASNADPHLEHLVGITNSVRAFGLSFTVQVPGATISGDLIPYHQWLVGSRDLLERAGEGLGELYSDELEHELGLLKAEEDDGETEWRVPRYIHIGRARIVDGSGISPSQTGLFWRGRLSEVTGWAIGALGTLEDGA